MNGITNDTSGMGPHYETACSLARGFCCGNCDRDQAQEWRCDEDGCCSLRDGIYEEMKAAVNRVAPDAGTLTDAHKLADLIAVHSKGLRRVYTGSFGGDRTEKLEKRQIDMIVAALRHANRAATVPSDVLGALQAMYDLYLSAPPGTFANGVTCQNGIIDEGEVRAGEIADRARAVILAATKSDSCSPVNRPIPTEQEIDAASSVPSKDELARAIYAEFDYDARTERSPYKPVWVPGGNSLKQGEARRCASAALALMQRSSPFSDTSADLREALEPFAKIAFEADIQARYADPQFHVNLGVMNGNVTQAVIRNKLTVEDFRRAARALSSAR